MHVDIWVRMCTCVALSFFPLMSFALWCFPNFDGSGTPMKININRVLSASDHCFFPCFSWVLWFSHSSPGKFGTGGLLPFPRSDLFSVLFCLIHWSVFQSSALSLFYPPLTFLSVTLLCHFSFTSYNIQYITPTTRHCQANIPPSTGHENSIAESKADKCPTSTSHFSPFNSCLSVIL